MSEYRPGADMSSDISRIAVNKYADNHRYALCRFASEALAGSAR